MKTLKEHPKAFLFHQAYANIPLGLRREIVAVVDGEPMTFHVIHLELQNKTVMGWKAVDQMVRIGIL